VLRLDYPDYRVIVCDNDSSDNSLDHIRGWARGEIMAETGATALAGLTTPPVPKPIPFADLGPGTASQEAIDSAVRLVLIQTGANLGFAGGNNVGLRHALNNSDCAFAWLLNNDTVVRPDALSQLVSRMKDRPDAGICGSTLFYYDDPGRVQAFGGSIYNKWLARVGHIGGLASATQLARADEVEPKLAYIVGASMLVRRSFLQQVGLMDKQYFLTFEEIDWATRAKGQFALAYAPQSMVYHKEGSSLGSHRVASFRSAVSEFYAIRNRILFTRKHYPFALPSVLCAIGISAVHRVVHGRWRNFIALSRGVLQGLTTRPVKGSS
jgi:GT2 family glycosyltransferase